MVLEVAHPRIRCGNNRDVDEQRRLRMPEVQRGQIEQIRDQNNLGGPEVTPNPKHDVCEHEQIVLRLSGDSSAGDAGLTRMK